MLYKSQGIIQSIQSEFFRRLEIRELPSRLIVPSLLMQLLQTDDEIIHWSLGDLGQKLKVFAQEIDYSHPDIKTLFDGALTDEQDFSKNCRELLSLASLAKEKQLNRVLPFLGQIIVNHSPDVVQEITRPTHFQPHVRLLKDPEEREEIRLLKKMQAVELAALYRRGEDLWQALPDNFNKFLRFETAYQEEIKKAEKKANRYAELGCTSLAEEINKNIEQFRQEMDQPYYGFNRITLMNAAIILAKSLGYYYQTQHFLSFQEEISDRVLVKREFFTSCNFTTLDLRDLFVYEPRVYPLHDFWDIAPKSLPKTIKTFENFPELGEKPLFDYYGILVPGIAFPHHEPIFVNQQGLIQSYSSMEEATKEFDKMLVKNGFLLPIIVGERDRKCYFICYFGE